MSRLLEAIMDANHRAVAGDASAAVHPGDFPDELPLAALTCIDARLNSFFPGVLGLPKEQFIWLRNAGNIITGPTRSTMRSLALACAVKGAKEIAVIGHTDCQVAKTSAMKLLDAFKALGVDRHNLPENLTEFFGLFASERQNVITGVEFVRRSPLIGLKIPIHGLIVDTETGKLDWVVNGYQALEMAAAKTELPMGSGLEFPVAIDTDWRTLHQWWLDGAKRDFTSVSFLIDRQGAIRQIHPGGEYVKGDKAYAEMKAGIEKLLAEK